MNEIKAKKKLIRAEILSNRNQLPLQFIQEQSQIILGKLKKLVSFKNIKNVHIYFPINGEVDTKKFIEELCTIGINVYFSRQEKSSLKISKNKITILKNGLLNETSVKRFPYFPVIVIPGVAFDQSMNRLGFGGGFYDRFLSKRPKSLKIGLAFDFQIQSALPTEKTDQKMDLLITEKRVFE